MSTIFQVGYVDVDGTVRLVLGYNDGDLRGAGCRIVNWSYEDVKGVVSRGNVLGARFVAADCSLVSGGVPLARVYAGLDRVFETFSNIFVHDGRRWLCKVGLDQVWDLEDALSQSWSGSTTFHVIERMVEETGRLAPLGALVDGSAVVRAARLVLALYGASEVQGMSWSTHADAAMSELARALKDPSHVGGHVGEALPPEVLRSLRGPEFP